MPGIAGIVKTQGYEVEINLLHRMCRSIKHEAWHKMWIYSRADCFLGRVHLDIFNAESRPVFNEDKSLCLLLEGKVYGYKQELSRLIQKGHKTKYGNESEFLADIPKECRFIYAAENNNHN